MSVIPTTDPRSTSDEDIDRTLPVAGIRVAGATVERPRQAVENPARRGETVGYLALGLPEDVDSAVEAAVHAVPGWAATPPLDRARSLQRAADVLEIEIDRLADLLVAEVGKVRSEALGDARGAPALLRLFASYTDQISAAADGRSIESKVRGDVTVRYVPKGPVAVIPPWNTPVYLAFMAIAPALMAGNPVVVKPPEVAPLALTAALDALSAVLPVGVVGIVNGLGSDAGAALAGHPGIRKVLFTGSVPTGTAVMQAAATNITDVGMELGGNDAAIVLDDVHIDEDMIAEFLAGSFGLSGQICYNIKRIYVHSSRFEEFARKLGDGMDRLVIGDPADPRAHIGPLATPSGPPRIAELIRDAEERGATISYRGTMLETATPAAGHYVRPALVIGGDPLARIVQEEQFGPAIPVIPFDTEAEAIALANGTEFGLAGSVWSANVDRARGLAGQLLAGTVFVNIHRVGASPAEAPFGGFRRSGIGRNHGMESVLSCMETQTLVTVEDEQSIAGFERWRRLLNGMSESDRADTD
ncbi:aldehyde dehydrogenase [Microbacterium sp. 18062]|uniref:aldehyde dehydrogenase family protein n=1 Tax=Microbacterium sp. 18062 TaxID=2681410 RepID=UPI00135A04FC|nr:aldehyde dehydrogenase family protein [Microbacterium sp. 18062]